MDFKIIFLLISAVFSLESAAESSILPIQLKTEYLHNPLTLETPNPRFSWRLQAHGNATNNLTQTAYQILVSSSKDAKTADLWDSGVVQSDASTHIHYAGKPLKSRQLATWKVKVWDQAGAEVESPSFGQFGIGLLHRADWKAKWIQAPVGLQKDVTHTLHNEEQTLTNKLQGLVPPLYFRKSFHLDQVNGARLFATAKGLYEIYLNGKKLEKSHFTPGYTVYHKSFRYQSYGELENHLHKGKNVIGVVVAPGWYAGYLGYGQTSGIFGTDIGALVQLDVNDVTVVESDASWKVSTGPIVYSDLLQGETYYVEKEINGWNDVMYNDSHWKQATGHELSAQVELLGDVSEPVITTKTLRAHSVHQSAPGVFIFDFGQNFVGVVSLTVPAGHGPGRIQLRHAEALEKPYMTGSLYTANLRSARATDTLVIKDKLTQPFTFTPSFTFHGFRFVEVTGFGSTPKLTDLVGNVMHSGFALNSHMKTSNELVNRLLLNIQWGLRSNFLSVPTDCPQRDERLGWTADAQVFAPTAVYNADLAAFFTKWMTDVRQSQHPNGALPDTVPEYEPHEGSPGWQDAMVVVPWVVYNAYGDKQIIKDNYVAMAKFVEYIRLANPDHIWKNRVDHVFGDWLEVNASTDKQMLSTAYYAQDALLMSKMAAAIGKTEDAKMYTEFFHNISKSFNEHYVKSDGTIQSDTQAAYAFALAYQLLPEKIRPLAAQKLADNVKKHNNHLTTGFLGVGLLNPVLSENGHNDVAYHLLLQDSYPSWLYPIAHGNATTIWERWDGWTEARGFYDSAMNSFNHYSLGSVGVWLYSQVAGITSEGAGYKNILIKPNPGPCLSSVSASFDSIHGPIVSEWVVSGENVQYTVTIPVNTKATIVLPGETAKHKVGSGTWKFTAKKRF